MVKERAREQKKSQGELGWGWGVERWDEPRDKGEESHLGADKPGPLVSNVLQGSSNVNFLHSW